MGSAKRARSWKERQYPDTNGFGTVNLPKSVIGLAQTCSNPHGQASDTTTLKENGLWNVRRSAS